MVIGSTGAWKGPFGYSGSAGYQEDETGLQLLGHRYYDSSTGRFITRDPIKDGRNWYGYCDNNPITRVDADGLSWEILDELSKGEVWLGGVKTGLAALGSNLTLGFWDGGEYANSPGFNESRICWFIAQLAIAGVVRIVVSAAGRVINISVKSLQHAFKHAADFGIKGTWNNKTKEEFLKALIKFVKNPRNVVKKILYRGKPGHQAVVDPRTGQAVILDDKGNFVAAWKLSAKQLEHVMKGGNLY